MVNAITGSTGTTPSTRTETGGSFAPGAPGPTTVPDGLPSTDGNLAWPANPIQFALPAPLGQITLPVTTRAAHDVGVMALAVGLGILAVVLMFGGSKAGKATFGAAKDAAPLLAA